MGSGSERRRALYRFCRAGAAGRRSALLPCVEIGWRLAAAHWGNGYAAEAARAALACAFDTLHLPEVVSFTAEDNQPSRRVMERIGMLFDDETFLHPRLPAGHPLQKHVLYRLNRQTWRERRGD